MKESVHCKMVKGDKAREFLRKTCFEYLKAMEPLRGTQDVPTLHTFYNYVDLLVGNTLHGSSIHPSMLDTMHPTWSADFNARGWLDGDNPERTCMSECSINPYCWVSAVTGILLAYMEACNELEEQLYERDTGRKKNYGPVRSRLGEGFARKQGGQVVHPPIGQGTPPPKRDKAGRPPKPTKGKYGIVRTLRAKASDPTGMPNGRPPGKKDGRDSDRYKLKQQKRKIRNLPTL